MAIYWEATGELKKQIAAMIDQKTVAMKRLRAFAKRYGGELGVAEGAWGTNVGIIRDDAPDAKNWKLVKGSGNCWKPKCSTKEGKAIDAEMEELAKAVPSRDPVGKLIEMPLFDGDMRVRTPGFTRHGSRIFLGTHDGYKRPDKLSKQLKRISDLDYERIADKDKK